MGSCRYHSRGEIHSSCSKISPSEKTEEMILSRVRSFFKIPLTDKKGKEILPTFESNNQKVDGNSSRWNSHTRA
ncbi:Uncharacterized protein APZ42_022167 [Daphnia magna]|uniref:Uncharacterized protein n=1 Tax=Daphnia magna TaxID=35525 RepID=A0A0P6F8A4_9CRUS|nr:Uncharacterized protein APZ42_022167 [Daphnia magna]